MASGVPGKPVRARDVDSGHVPRQGAHAMKVAIIGSGKIGATLARRLTETGHEVTLANTRGAGSLAPLVAELGPLARAADDIAGAAAAADVIVLAMPFF